MSKIFKVSCEFYVRANNARDVFSYCREDLGFVGKDIGVEVEEMEGDIEVYEDLTKEGRSD